MSLFRNPCAWVMYCKTPKIRKYTRGFLNELFSPDSPERRTSSDHL
nr:MAG TPA: hypothetical protein [Caudoviricetes sp.]